MPTEFKGKVQKSVADELKIDEDIELAADSKIVESPRKKAMFGETTIQPRTLKPTIAGYFLVIAFILNLLVPLTFIMLIYDAEIASGDTSLKGRLLDEDEQPTANVTVSILNTNLTTKTDDNGRYTFDKVSVGDHKIQFTKDGYQGIVVYKLLLSKGLLERIGRKNNVISFPGSLQNGFPVDPIDGPYEDSKILNDNLSGSIHGQITNQSGNPLEKIEVKVLNTDLPAVLSDTNGNYYLDGVTPGVITIQVTQSQNATKTTRKILFTTNNTLELDITYNDRENQTIDEVLGKLGTIMGVVKNTKGKPVKNAKVILENDKNKDPISTTVTIRNGTFAFIDVPIGLYNIEVIRQNHSISRAKNITINNGSQTVELEMELTNLGFREIIEDDLSSAYTCTIILVLFAIITLAGAISALQRKRYGVAFFGSLLGMLPVLLPIRLDICLASIFSLIGLVLLVFSREEFKFKSVK
jgi:hypothetical protein